MKRVTSQADRWAAGWAALPPLALFLLALAWRAYRLSANPLWLDELYETQLVQQGLGGILRNSLWDQWPPLYHLGLWAGVGFGPAPSAWSVRWLSVLAGALTVPVVYVSARRIAGPGTALAAALLLLLSPTHLYFSQEARAYGLVACIAALSAWTLLTRRLSAAACWRWWAALTVIGLWSTYSYAMIALVQALYVVPRAAREAGGRAALLTAAAGLVVAVALGVSPLLGRAARLNVATLSLKATLQSLVAGDPLRYGLYWGHTWLVASLVALALLGTWRVLARGSGPARMVIAGQVLLPLALFFLVLGPLAGLHLEAYQARQFLMLLPAGFVLVGAGLAQAGASVAGRVGRWPALAAGALLMVFLLHGSLAGVWRYWAQTKSPEGLAVLYIAERIAPGEAVVSLHYSADAAISFYGPAAPHFTKPQDTPDGVAFSDSLSVLLWDWPAIRRPYTLADVKAYPDRWVVWAAGENDALAAALTVGCIVADVAEYWPFRLARATACPARGG